MLKYPELAQVWGSTDVETPRTATGMESVLVLVVGGSIDVFLATVSTQVVLVVVNTEKYRMIIISLIVCSLVSLYILKIICNKICKSQELLTIRTCPWHQL